MINDLRARLAVNIKVIRQQMGISQEKLAEMANLHRTYIGAIERGERNITLETLETISKALHTSPLALLDNQKGENEKSI